MWPASQSPHGPQLTRYTFLPNEHNAYSLEAKYMDHKYAQMYMVVRFSIPILKHLIDSP